MADTRTWFQKLCTNVVCQGPIPKHIGVILDGNRRFARKLGLKTIEGHRQGYEKFMDTLRWCQYLEVQEVTAYLFSIENFKRPQEEVDALMKLAAEKLTKFLNNREQLMNDGICMQIIGDWSLFPQELRKLMAELMILTRHNSKFKINLAFAYTSRNEIARGVESLHFGIKNGDLELEDIDEDLLSQSFQTVPGPPVDLMIRTSGESRLSDFLLWQSSESVLCFVDILWPEMNFWTFLNITLQFQANYLSMKKLGLSIKNGSDRDSGSKSRQQNFIAKLRDSKIKLWENTLL